jgi:cysteine-rich repeat protein
VEFRLDAASDFTLWASSGPAYDTFSTHLELRTAAGDPIYSQYVSEYLDFDERGVLPAGDYVLEIESHVQGLMSYDGGDSYFDFTLVSCGDGLIVGTERCDDGGTTPGDGCDASCQIEPGWDCVGEPSVCSEICGDDADGVPHAEDNCICHTNPSQADSDLDGYGNACDIDYNNDGWVAGDDFGAFKSTVGGLYDERYDHDCDGAVGGTDFNRFKQLFGTGLGPSGLSCAGTPPCPVTAHGCIEVHCDDTYDNDRDGDIDCADTDCLDAPECQ